VCMCASCKNSHAKTPLSRMPDTSPQALLSLDYSEPQAQKTIQYAEEPQLDPKHKPSPDRLVLFALLRPLQNSVFWHDSLMHNVGVCVVCGCALTGMKLVIPFSNIAPGDHSKT